MPLHVSSTVLIRRRKLYYTASGVITETSDWSKIAEIQFYKYEHIVVKFMYGFFGCGYRILLTINMLCRVENTFMQLLNLLRRY